MKSDFLYTYSDKWAYFIYIYIYIFFFSRKIKVGKQANMGADSNGGSLPVHEQASGPSGESKLELFGFDSLVNILGLKR